LQILVTGAAGFIGKSLVPRLLAAGHQVRTFSRSAQTACPGVQHMQGDITDKKLIAQAVDGCEVVFHLAGLVSYRQIDIERQREINVIGTRYVMEAALNAGVKRLVHTSSIAAMGIPDPGSVGNEELVYNLSGRKLGYCDSKHAAEQEVQEFVKRGLPAVILCPGIIFGAGDTHPHHHAIFLALSKGWLVGWPKGGVTFCDIEDVVEAHINAMTMGQIGQRYVLGSANLSYRDAAIILAGLIGARPPRFEIPGWLISLAAEISEGILPLLRLTPSLTRQSAWLAQQDIFFSWDKAVAELNAPVTPFEHTMKRVIPYYLRTTDDGN
jgi:dihydroflavonol-4-reductase